jgi:hypothetical protein
MAAARITGNARDSQTVIDSHRDGYGALLMSTGPEFQLRLLGGFSLHGSARFHDVIGVSSKKGRALLAYVAMQEQMRAGRERLASLLWPDQVDRQAR